jgi:phosphoglycolate phosphatase
MTQKVIFFDIDGTLLSTGGAGQKAIEMALMAEFQIEFPFEGVLTAGRTDRGIADEVLERYQHQNSQENRDRFRLAYLDRLPTTLADAPGKLLPRVAELVHELAQHDHITLSVLTGNYEAAAWIKLRHYQLEQYFTFGGFGDDEADRDEVARLALRAARHALNHPIDGAHTMVIGDTPADIRCARAIGAKAVAVATGTYDVIQLQPHSPDHLFENFSETDDVVKRILELL